MPLLAATALAMTAFAANSVLNRWALAGGLASIGEPVTWRFALAAAIILGGVAWATWERR